MWTKVMCPQPTWILPISVAIWKLEVSLKCRPCRKGKYAPPVHMIRQTSRRTFGPTPVKNDRLARIFITR